MSETEMPVIGDKQPHAEDSDVRSDLPTLGRPYDEMMVDSERRNHEAEAMAGLLVERLDLFTKSLGGGETVSRLPRLSIALQRERTLVHGEKVEGVAYEQDPESSISKLAISKPLPAGSLDAYIVTWRQAEDTVTQGGEGLLTITSVESGEEQSLVIVAGIRSTRDEPMKGFHYDVSKGPTDGMWPPKPIKSKSLLSSDKAEKLLEGATDGHKELFDQVALYDESLALNGFGKLIDRVWQGLDDIEREAVTQKLRREEFLTPEQRAIIGISSGTDSNIIR